MADVLNTPLHDDDLLAEISLTGDLMIVATEADGPIGQHTIDRVLGVRPARGTCAGEN